MFDLPEMMQGVIHQDYRETMQSAWLLDGREREKKEVEDQSTSGPMCSNDPTACASGNDTCDCRGDDRKEKHHAMPPVAGWSTPPALHIR